MKPILFEIGSLSVPSYAFMLSLSFIIGSLIIIKFGKKQGISTNKLFGLIISVQIASVFGARFLFVINNYSQFESDFLEIFSLSPGGFALNGGLVFGILAGAIFIKLNKLSLWKIIDLAAPSLALGVCLTRIGCFLGGCCYGKETSLFFGIQFPEYSMAAQTFGIQHFVHPTQLYEALSGLIILTVLLFVQRRESKFDGQLFLSFIILYLFVRILNDAFRGDALDSYFSILSQTQLFSIMCGLVAVLVYWMKLRYKTLEKGGVCLSLFAKSKSHT